MKKLMRCLPTAALLLGLAACAGRPAIVTLEGEPDAIGTLAGQWQGEYWGAESGRSGTIDFSVSGSRDSVTGEVRMIDPTGRPLHSVDATGLHSAHVRGTQTLAIELVRISETSVSGRMEPYLAPDCQCTVSTSFVGVVRGDSIVGTFVTRFPGGGLDEGHWRVVRVAKRP